MPEDEEWIAAVRGARAPGLFDVAGGRMMLIADETNADQLRAKLARRRQRMDELRDMLWAGRSIGECDNCHLDRLELSAEDPSEPGGWQYCRACIREMQHRIARHIQLIQRRLRELGQPEDLHP